MKRFVFILVLFYSANLCSQPKLPSNPPGTVKIKDNVFMDADEISNNDYHEYLNWLRGVFTEGSSEYINALPDSTLSPDYYFKNPEAGNYPVIGITYEQATAYCKWRTDRIYERDLALKKIINYDPDQNENDYFSVENVKKGAYKVLNKKELQKIQLIEFRLPTKEEWEFAASGGLNVEIYPYGLKDTSHIKQKLTIGRSTKAGIIQTSSFKRGYPNALRISNMIGNVAEMIEEKGIAKGGSWKDNLEDCKIQVNISYDKPTNWLGFRCVCGYKGLEQM